MFSMLVKYLESEIFKAVNWPFWDFAAKSFAEKSMDIILRYIHYKVIPTIAPPANGVFAA